MQSPDIAVAPGVQKSFCYYFHTNNTTDLDISVLDATISPNVEHMAVIFTEWNSAPFLAPTNPLTYSCVYTNPTGFAVTQGPSRTTQENCMVLSYFFPATTSRLCVNNNLLP